MEINAHSFNALSTFIQNTVFSLKNETTSSGYTTVLFILEDESGEIPNASARFAFRLAIRHACAHSSFCELRGVGLDTLAPHGVGCEIRPQAQVWVIISAHGSISGHAEGA